MPRLYLSFSFVEPYWNARQCLCELRPLCALAGTVFLHISPIATTTTTPAPTREKESHKEEKEKKTNSVCKCRNFNRGIEYKSVTCLGKHVWITAITHSPHHYIDILPTNLYKLLRALCANACLFFAKTIFGRVRCDCWLVFFDPIRSNRNRCLILLKHSFYGNWLINWAALISSFGVVFCFCCCYCTIWCNTVT